MLLQIKELFEKKNIFAYKWKIGNRVNFSELAVIDAFYGQKNESVNIYCFPVIL